jgi:hypothetical protein
VSTNGLFAGPKLGLIAICVRAGTPPAKPTMSLLGPFYDPFTDSAVDFFLRTFKPEVEYRNAWPAFKPSLFKHTAKPLLSAEVTIVVSEL